MAIFTPSTGSTNSGPVDLLPPGTNFNFRSTPPRAAPLLNAKTKKSPSETPPPSGVPSKGSTPPPSETTSTPLLRKAMEDQMNYCHATISTTLKPDRYLCAGVTAAICSKLKEHIDTKSPVAIKSVNGAWGHADDPKWSTVYAQNTGLYDLYTYRATSTADAKKYLNGIKWNYGDAVQYYAVNPGTNVYIGGGSSRHCIVYKGDIEPKLKKIRNDKDFPQIDPNWTTDEPRNYGKLWVYGDTDREWLIYVSKVKPEYLK